VKGDSTVACIAAASIVAKVCRDALMVEADEAFPGYGLASNKGYASEGHIQAIRERGLTPLHRATFCRGFLQQQLFLP
jgi:ribonuclease HII